MNDIMQKEMDEKTEISSSDVIELAESFDRIDDLTNQIKILINDDKKVTEVNVKEKSNTSQEEIEILDI